MASFQEDKKHDFDLEIVLQSFKKCLRPDKTLDVFEYLTAYHELCRFFKLAGTLFGFVAMDLESKMRVLEYHLNSAQGHNYQTVQSMLYYEVRNGITHVQGSHPSGSRTLLRLHHALEFILRFMDRVKEGDENEKMSKLAWEVYVKTLYNHHPWLTQKLAAVAVYALPSKKHLIAVMCKQDYTNVMDLLAQVVNAGQPIYDITEREYVYHNIQNLP